MMKKLTREFYNQDTTAVAKALLGHYLVHQVHGVQKVGKIVETEAYLGQHDLACHASKGLTQRTKVMFGSPGYAYVYLIYGMYHCFNVVTEPEGIGSAVLIRALEPIENVSGRTCGPGLLCKAMMIDRHCNHQDLLSEHLFIADGGEAPSHQIMATSRIGVHYAKEWASKPLRFYIQGNAFISKT